MSQLPIRRRRSASILIAVAAAAMLTAASVAHAQQVVALVNGEPITALDIEQRTKLVQMSATKTASRQDVLNGLIDEILEVQEGKRFGIVVPDSEVNTAFANIGNRMGLDAEKLAQTLAHGGASDTTLKHRLRAELAWDALIRGRFKASLEVRDSDVEAELQLHKPEEKNDVGFEYLLRPIVLIVPRGSPDGAFEARKKDADALRARFLNCGDGIPFARALREVAVRDQVSKFSSDLPPELRAILDGTEVGHLTPPDQTGEGIQMFALCTKRETKTDTSAKKEIRNTMFQKKFGARAKRYLDDLRRGAMIEYKQANPAK